MKYIASAVLILTTLPLCAATVNNDDSCDIATLPAATLLLPYFEVDLVPAGSGNITIFSITNISAMPQIARVTLWTDWAFPVLSFDIFLTGYDVQPINLFDVIARGLVGSLSGTSTASPNARDANGKSTNPNLGTTPETNLANPRFLATAESACARGRLPGALPLQMAADVRTALSTGAAGPSLSCKSVPGVAQTVGSNHGPNKAIGYATIDVIATCSSTMPTDADYWSEMLYDNVLTGDYAHVASNASGGNFAGGNPMVHIRAIPEGGAAGVAVPTDLPFTFYNRFTTADRRQPLPSTFGARWISGTGASFDTSYSIWREGVTTQTSGCDQYARNAAMPYIEIVRFDEHENAAVNPGVCMICPPVPVQVLPATSLRPVTSVNFPVVAGSTDAGGWTYFNLNNGGASSIGAPYTASRPGYGSQTNARDVSQNWVTVSMFAEGRFGVEYDATALGNGCSPGAGRTENTHIGPASNVNP